MCFSNTEIERAGSLTSGEAEDTVYEPISSTSDRSGTQAMMDHLFATIEKDGWTLESAESRHARHPETFEIPSRAEREALTPGDGAQLIFDIETREAGHVSDRGSDRLWVIVKKKLDGLYIGVLDSDPGAAEGLTLRQGVEILFAPEHVIAIDRPPDGYVLEKFGDSFFRD